MRSAEDRGGESREGLLLRKEGFLEKRAAVKGLERCYK